MKFPFTRVNRRKFHWITNYNGSCDYPLPEVTKSILKIVLLWLSYWQHANKLLCVIWTLCYKRKNSINFVLRIPPIHEQQFLLLRNMHIFYRTDRCQNFITKVTTSLWQCRQTVQRKLVIYLKKNNYNWLNNRVGK